MYQKNVMKRKYKVADKGNSILLTVRFFTENEYWSQISIIVSLISE